MQCGTASTSRAGIHYCVIWTPPGVKHWHGATGGDAMTHIAIQGYLDGSPVEWTEHVTDTEYEC